MKESREEGGEGKERGSCPVRGAWPWGNTLATLDKFLNSLSPISFICRTEIIMGFFRDVMRIINDIAKGG